MNVRMIAIVVGALLLVPIGFRFYLDVSARRADWRTVPVSAGPYRYLQWNVEVQRVMMCGESQILTVSIYGARAADVSVSISCSSKMTLSPSESSVIAHLREGSPWVGNWIITPVDLGRYHVVVKVGYEQRAIAIVVRNLFGMTARAEKWFTSICTFISSNIFVLLIGWYLKERWDRSALRNAKRGPDSN